MHNEVQGETKRFMPGMYPKVKPRMMGDKNPRKKIIALGKKITDVSEINQDYGRINFYISPKKLYEETGYIWRGERR